MILLIAYSKVFAEDNFDAIGATAALISIVFTRLPIETVDKSIELKSFFNNPPVDIADDPIYFSVFIVSFLSVSHTMSSEEGLTKSDTPLVCNISIGVAAHSV